METLVTYQGFVSFLFQISNFMSSYSALAGRVVVGLDGGVGMGVAQRASPFPLVSVFLFLFSTAHPPTAIRLLHHYLIAVVTYAQQSCKYLYFIPLYLY